MKQEWFVHIEWVVVLITLLGGFYTLDSKIERQSARTDRLYEIYVESNEKWNERWADTQNELVLLRKGGK